MTKHNPISIDRPHDLSLTASTHDSPAIDDSTYSYTASNHYYRTTGVEEFSSKDEDEETTYSESESGT